MAAPAAADIGRVIWPPGAGPEPRVPVHLFLGRLRLLGQPGVAHLGGVPGCDVRIERLGSARAARSGELDRRDERAFAQALDAGLIDAAVPPRRLDDHPALGDRHARRLLGVDVLAAPHGHAGRQRVPAIAGGDQDRVDVGSGREEFAHFRIHLAVGAAVVLVDDLLDCLATNLASVADRHELNVLLAEHPLQVELASASQCRCPAMTMRSLGAVAPSRPRALAGMIVGARQRAPAAAVVFFRYCRRFSFVARGPFRDIVLSPS